MNLDNYDYFLPEKNLALEPAVPRDSSKLFIYDTVVDKITFDYFYNLDKYLPKDSFMVMNNTKVLPARVTMKKETGGKVVVLLLVNEIIGDSLPIIVDRKIKVGEKIFFDDKNFLYVTGQKENVFEVKISCLPVGRDFSREYLFELLRKYGAMPIPPYLKKSSLSKDDLLKKYQTIFARAPVGARLASVAAPTASLHFTDSIFSKLEKKQIQKYFVTLHVGMGTFAPITEENIRKKKLHNEFYEVDSRMYQSINRLIQEGKKLVAVGTTVVRTLESVARQQNHYKTNLFIFPPYDFKMVDILITNFHLPKSSLMMLVEAFLQHKKAKRHLVDLYNIAIKNNFRFYSFGDAMVIT